MTADFPMTRQTAAPALMPGLVTERRAEGLPQCRVTRLLATAMLATLLFGGCQQVAADGTAATAENPGSDQSAPLQVAQAQSSDKSLPGVRTQQKIESLPAVEAIPSAAGAYLAGRQAQAVRDMRAAAQFFDVARKLAPDTPEIQRRAFLAHLAAGNIANAAALAPKIRQEDRQGLAALVQAITALRAAEYAPAIEATRGMGERGLAQIVGPLLLAWGEAGAGRSEAGLSALEKIKDNQGVAPLYLLHRALILDLAGKMTEAAAAYDELAKRQERLSLRFAEMLANFHMREGQAAKAEAVIEGYRKQNPDSVLIDAVASATKTSARPKRVIASPAQAVAEALFDIASLLHQERATDQAQLYAQLALYLRPSHTASRMLLGEVLESQRRLEDAIDVYHEVGPDTPFSWSARLRIADNLDDLKRDDEAVDLLERMAKERPDRYDALTRKGNLLRGRERFAEAAEAYDRAIERIPTIEGRHWSLLYSRGIALERAKQWSRAEGDFIKALELEPEQPYVLNYLGYSWVEQGINLDKAKAMIRRAVEQRPNDGYIVDSLGWVLYRLGDFQGAVIQLERAVELRPQDPVINDHLGDAYWQVGRRLEADFQWKRAQGLAPEPELAEQLKAKLAGTGRPAPTSVVQSKP